MNNKEYTIRDLGETAALITSGCKLLSIQWKDKTAYFTFSEPKKCESLARDYYASGLIVDARKYYDNLRLVKRKLYSNDKKI